MGRAAVRALPWGGHRRARAGGRSCRHGDAAAAPGAWGSASAQTYGRRGGGARRRRLRIAPAPGDLAPARATAMDTGGGGGGEHWRRTRRWPRRI